jgi:hypothetical protein
MEYKHEFSPFEVSLYGLLIGVLNYGHLSEPLPDTQKDTCEYPSSANRVETHN